MIQADSCTSLKLTVEPIPVTSARKSLNRLLSKSQWDKIRKKVYAEYDHRCGICSVDPKLTPARVFSKHAPKLDIDLRGRYKHILADPPLIHKPARVRLECHEIWEYNETTYVQRLSDLMALCIRCHQVKHWNWAATKKMPPSFWPEEMKTRYEGAPLRKGSPWRGVWDDEQKFALYRELNSHKYLLEDHFMWVNDCDLKTLAKHVEEAAEMCFQRSQHEWQIDFGKFIELLED